MRYRIEYADGRYCNFANGRAELLKWLNLLTDRVDIVRDLGWRRNTSALTDTDVKYLLLYFEQNYGLTSEKKMTAALSIVANENCYHPIQDVLNGLVWDGTPRIRSCLHHFLGAEVSDYVEEMVKHFLLGAIRRVFSPGSKYEEMLCLVGGQGAGKSSFFRPLAIRDEWFSDDLKKLDDDRVFLKLQGHWIIEMSEMLATSSAKSIEEIRSFISRQKETYRTPYEAQPKDRLRQCVFGGSSNTLDFLPLDRAGNRRFLPIMIYPENAEVHILENEDASIAYLLQVWAEAMTVYRSGHYSMKFSKSIQRQLVEVQKDFMPEDTEAGQIQGFLEHYTGSMVCSKQLFKEALGHTYDEPKRWQLHNINEIMNTVLPSGLSLYGGSLWKKASSKKIKSVLSWCGSSAGRSPCGKPLSSSLSARPANTSRNGGISGKWQKKLRKNG